MKQAIRCDDVDKVKSLDRLLDDQMDEFDSGKDKVCDKDMDKMIWELGDYENEESTMEAGEFEEEKPIEEQFDERKNIHGSNDRPYYMKDESAQKDTDENIISSRASRPGIRRRSNNTVRGNSAQKNKH